MVFKKKEEIKSKYLRLLLKADLMAKHLKTSAVTNKQEQIKPHAADLASQSSCFLWKVFIRFPNSNEQWLFKLVDPPISVTYMPRLIDSTCLKLWIQNFYYNPVRSASFSQIMLFLEGKKN